MAPVDEAAAPVVDVHIFAAGDQLATPADAADQVWKADEDQWDIAYDNAVPLVDSNAKMTMAGVSETSATKIHVPCHLCSEG